MTNQPYVAVQSTPSSTHQPTPTLRSQEAALSGSPSSAAANEPAMLELLVQITLRLRLRGVDIESSTGLSGRELDLIALLTESGPTSVKSLVADLGLPRSTMTAIVDRLEARGLVNRLPNPEDRRSVILQATPVAFDALLRYREGMKTFAKHLEGLLEDDEQSQLIRLIEKIAASL